MKSRITILPAVSVAVLAILVVVYGAFLRPLKIWVDGPSWKVSGPSAVGTIGIISYQKQALYHGPGKTIVSVPFFKTNGSISIPVAPDPKRTGTAIKLSSTKHQVVEATSSSGVQWVYEIWLSE